MEKYFVNQKNHNFAVIGGVVKLKEFSSEEVLVAVSGADISVSGNKLLIDYFNSNEIGIKGKIEVITTIKKSRGSA